MSRALVSRLLLIALLAALLATPLVVKRLSATPGYGNSGAPSPGGADVSDRYGFRFTEVAKASGIEFVHQAPTLDAKLAHIMPQIASMGAAASVADYDRDGWVDLYVVNSGEGSRNALYRNQHDGTFKDVAADVGAADLNQPGTGVCMGSVWADFDNDGFEDLFVYKWGRPELFRNDAGKHFVRVTDTAGLPPWVNANTAVWLDYDRDGRVDLFVGGYYPETLNLWKLETTRMMPESFEYAENGGRKYLLRNNGDGTFADVTEQMGIKSRRWTLAAAAADLRGTGYPDLFLANDYGVPELFLNDNGKQFREVGKDAGIGVSPKSGMNATFGDVMNQGAFAIYKTNISEEGVLLQGNDLWVPETGVASSAGHGTPKYVNLAREMGVELGGWSWGAQFGDFNNDGTLDLYLTNGYVSADRSKSYWYDFAKVAGGHRSIISDAKNWPAMGDRSLSGYQQKRVWLNDGAGRYQDVAQAVGATDTYDGRAVAVADLWNRGALDVIVATQRGPLLLYRNTVTPANAWIGFDLSGGPGSNRSAIGAQVRVYWNGQQQVQEVSGGNGFCAQNDRRLHFGLGKDPKLEKVEIRWPSGKTQTLTSPETGKIHQLSEPQ
jgi:enediyne biosynthesis protein E4